jgi:hypothetical protein
LIGHLRRVRGVDVVDGEEAGGLILLALEVGNLALHVVDMCVSLWPHYVEEAVEDRMSVALTLKDEDEEEEEEEEGEETEEEEDEWSEWSETSVCEEEQEQEEQQEALMLRERHGFGGRYVGVREMDEALQEWGKRDLAINRGKVFGPGVDAEKGGHGPNPCPVQLEEEEEEEEEEESWDGEDSWHEDDEGYDVEGDDNEEGDY